jgi:UDPglucose--hexose-1-phosphate uridylyltransferase
MSEIRLNLITGDWVIIATDRAARPHDFVHSRERIEAPTHSDSCPFCPGNEEKTPGETHRISAPDHSWIVRSVPNKFSVLSADLPITRQNTGFKNQISGVGLHEVIIETPRHNLTTAFYSKTHVRWILETYLHRFSAFFEDPRIKHIVLYKNHGPAAGTSLIHPHSQIVGTPVIPGQIRYRLENARRFCEEFGECLYCWTLNQELEEGTRIIAENPSFVAFVPYAALSPYHTWIFPRRHAASFGTITSEELDHLADLLRLVTGKLYTVLEDPDFNYVIRSLSPREGLTDHFHWYLAMVPRLSKAAGFELGTGMFINSSFPDDSAARLRDAEPPSPR